MNNLIENIQKNLKESSTSEKLNELSKNKLYKAILDKIVGTDTDRDTIREKLYSVDDVNGEITISDIIGQYQSFYNTYKDEIFNFIKDRENSYSEYPEELLNKIVGEVGALPILLGDDFTEALVYNVTLDIVKDIAESL